MSKNELNAIYLCSASLLIGLLTTIFSGEGHWFGRSGAVVTIIAIWFAALKLSDAVTSTLDFADIILQRDKSLILADFRKSCSTDEDAERCYEKLVRDTKKAYQEASEQTRQRILRLELSLWMIGAAVWGFGDLILHVFKLF